MIIRWLGTIAALMAGTGVGLGAFATHALKGSLSERALTIFETGVRYQMYHALAVLWIALILHQHPGAPALWWVAAVAMIAGVVIFSGSLYVLSVTDIRWWGAITPIGGAFLIGGWICLALGWWHVYDS